MKKIERFQITGMTISGFKCYQAPTILDFGPQTAITGGNGLGKTSIADAIAFAITGLPFFGERGIDKLHNEVQPEVSVSLRFLDEAGTHHELTRIRKKNRMTIHYDRYEIRQMDLTDMFGERDVFLSIFNPLYFIEELGDEGKNLLEMYLPMIPHETVMGQLSDGVQAALEGVEIPSPDAVLKNRREEIRKLEEHMIYLQGQKDQAVTQAEAQRQSAAALTERYSQLDSELKALEGKRFAGLDRARMESDLVALSARYNEAAQGSSTAQIDADILALSQKQAQQKVKALKVLISNVVIYARKRAELTFEALKMNRVAISLYDVMKTSGEQKAAFKFTYNGRRYDRLSLSEKIRAGMEVSELVKRLTGRNYPVFVDNMESVDDLANVRPTGQVIMAKCVHGAPLEVRPLRPIPTATEQRAA